MNTTRMSRRKLLRGLGAGAMLFGPMARSRLSMAEGNQGNLVLWSTPNGWDLRTWGVTGSGSEMTLDYAMKPFEPFKSAITYITGLFNQSPSRQVSTHDTGGKMTTCMAFKGPMTADQERAERRQVFGPSIDTVIAANSGGQQRSLNLVVKPMRAWHGVLTWRGANTPEEGFEEPKLAYDKIFGALAASDPAQASAMTADALRRKRSVLDLVLEDVRLFQGRLGATDRNVMEQHLESLRDLEGRLVAPVFQVPNPKSCNSAGLKTAVAAAVPSFSHVGAQMKYYSEAMTDVI